MSVQRSAWDLGSGPRAIEDFSEIVASVTRADVIVVWAMACAIGLVALVLG